MHRLITFIFIAALFISKAQAQTDTIILKDITWDKAAPAGMAEITIPSSGSLLQGFIYKPNGGGKHPTLLLLHGYPGNERNLDLAQVVRAHGWNVIYFDYRGSWGSGGQFSFMNAVEDVKNVVAYCKRYSDSLRIDTSNIVLFGHSMGGWICLKALQQLPGIKKGFALSTWNIGGDFEKVTTEQQLTTLINEHKIDAYFVLNTPAKDLFLPVLKNRSIYDLNNDANRLAHKQIIMLDEHSHNKGIADAIQKANKSYFQYEVWPTDHPFTNKRVALMKKVLAFLNR